MPTSSRSDRLQRSACLELVSTEEGYLATLECLTQVFLRPLRTWASEAASAGQHRAQQRKGIATVAEIDFIFGSVETLLQISRGLCEKLREAPSTDTGAAGDELPTTPSSSTVAPVHGGPDASALAETMAEWANGPLRLYAPHVKHFHAANAELRRLLGERHIFASVVRVLELQPRSKGLTLQALLVTTVQRLPRYTLLLREILKHTTVRPRPLEGGEGQVEMEEEDDDEGGAAPAEATAATLRDALAKIQAVTAGVDASVGDAERRARAMQVHRPICRPLYPLPALSLLPAPHSPSPSPHARALPERCVGTCSGVTTTSARAVPSCARAR